MAKILLVEDDNNLREIYEARLQAEGYDIVSAMDGEEALVIAKKEKPDLIISDVMMPRISGFEMLDILRNTEGLKQVKIIMLTALGQAEDKSRADSLGADRYLVKSQVTLEDIVKAAQELLAPAPAATGATTPTATASTTAAAEPAAQPASNTPTPAPKPAEEPPAGTPAPTTPPIPPTVTPPTPQPPAVPTHQQAVSPTIGTPAPAAPAVTPTPSRPPAPTTAAPPLPPRPSAPATQPAGNPAAASPSNPANHPPAAPVTPPAPSVANADEIMADAIKDLVSETEASTTEKATPSLKIIEPPAVAPSVAPAASQQTAITSAATSQGTASPTSAQAQTTSEEEAAIKAQIESFVNQQTTPVAEPVTPVQEPEKPAEPVTPVTTIPSKPPAQPPETESGAIKAPSSAPEPVIPSAAPTVIEPTIPQAAPSSTTLPPAAQSKQPPPATAKTAAETERNRPSDKREKEDDGVAIAHKKVISPIAHPEEPKTNLDDLLAKEGLTTLDEEEEAPEPAPPLGTVTPGGATPLPTPPVPTPLSASSVGTSGLPTTPHPPGHIISPTAPGGVDPNSIAL